MGSLIKSVVFDAYGTLIDTGDGSVRATATILRKNGVDLDPVKVYTRWKQLNKLHIESLETFIKDEDIILLSLKQLYTEYGIDGNPEQDVKLMLATLGIRRLFSETLEVINTLRKQYPLYIASTTDEEPLVSDMKRNSLVVDGYFTSESLQVYKPRKEFFTQVLANIRLTPEDIIYVGDSLRDDIYGAGQLSIRTVWINRKNLPLSKDDAVPDYHIHNLSELPPLIEEINLARQ